MNRFFLNPQNIKKTKITFPEDISHQIRHVLRLRQDDLVEVLDNSGKVYRVRLTIEPGSSPVTGLVMDMYEGETEPKISIVLYFGLTSREKVEWVLQKGTEIGVSVFQPFISERTLVQSLELPSRKVARWERIIQEAAEQAHRGRLPELEEPVPFAECLQRAKQENGLNLIAWEEADTTSRNLREALELFQGGRIGLFVGPEGGFSKNEVDLANPLDCQIVSLGRRILRMETAAILFPTLVLFELNAL
jgi:16S rRNA (uracil1498-N3)-methyltransferase